MSHYYTIRVIYPPPPPLKFKIYLYSRNRQNNEDELPIQVYYSVNNAYEDNADNQKGKSDTTYTGFETVGAAGNETRQYSADVCSIYGYGSSSRPYGDHKN